MKRLLMAAVAALSFNLAAAVEVAGVKFDDKTHVGTGDLVVNGAGLRKKAASRRLQCNTITPISPPAWPNMGLMNR